ncbi:MAG: protein-L-isoaspartate O-methyltransferase [Chitinophagales bacterium]|jgi:protein-L-isoaspartate(D-aspartate) O-methyltransferase|nr:protein-L-isoaspartate O-methyltransferase [Chitinophagales bacterium]
MNLSDYLKFDSMKTYGMRLRMVQELKEHMAHERFAYNIKAIEIMQFLPRHLFLNENGLERWVYMLNSVNIDEYQTMSHPSTVLKQTTLLDVSSQDRVLEIGTGSGYQAAVLSHLAKEVYTLERHYNLYFKSRDLFKQLQINNVFSFYGDGFEGLPQFQYFDKIIVTCGAPNLPQSLFDQLKIGGIMVIPIDKENEGQCMYKITKISQTELTYKAYGNFAFVPMLQGVEKSDVYFNSNKNNIT